MTLILCALLACCVPTCPTSMYDWDSCGISSIPPVSTQAGCGSTDPAPVVAGGLIGTRDDSKCGGAALPGRGCAPADESLFVYKGDWGIAPIEDYLTTPPAGAGQAGLWGLRCEVDTVFSPLPQIWAKSPIWIPPRHEMLYVRDIDTTCVWSRHERDLSIPYYHDPLVIWQRHGDSAVYYRITGEVKRWPRW